MGIKGENPDSILFFRMGDFYEMFFDDARIASRILGITLTARGTYNGEKVPMCGVPHHASKSYIARLVESGQKVAICEQVEDPKASKGIVKRDVVRVVTADQRLYVYEYTRREVTSRFGNDILAATQRLGGESLSIVACTVGFDSSKSAYPDPWAPTSLLYRIVVTLTLREWRDIS